MLLALGSAPAVAPRPDPIKLAQVTIREQILVRIRPLPYVPRPVIEWEEKRGPRCIPADSVAGAALLGHRSVDLVLHDRSRVRAKLESSCPALDFYYGFYVSRNADGQICADRDSIRSRVGGQCEIEVFRALHPVARD